MSILLETTLGDIFIELYTNHCPISCENFIKLCKIRYFNHCTLFSVDRNYITQINFSNTNRKDDESLYRILHGIQSHYFDHELRPSLEHTKKGIIAMVSK